MALAGKLYLVATPIGNLQDMTFRAVETLRHVDLIAAEDTRHAAILLRHYEIHQPVTSYHDFNERKVAPQLVAQMLEGKNIALITDAGSPGISDPGFFLVRAAVAENIIVESIPGASAVVAAVTISGLPCDRFVFEGFPPAKKGRQTFFQNLADEPRTMVLYEAPQRTPRTLQDILTYWGDRRVALARELSKIHEEVRRGKVSEILAGLQEQTLRGECVLVVEGRPKSKATAESTSSA